MKEHATACLGRDRGFLVTTECRKCQDKLLLVLGRGRGILVATEFLSGSVSQHGSQILSHRNCHNMGVLVLCRDRGFLVAAETVTTRGQGCDRSLVKAKRFQSGTKNCSVATGFHGVVSR